jgi:hypothetical protein
VVLADVICPELRVIVEHGRELSGGDAVIALLDVDLVVALRVETGFIYFLPIIMPKSWFLSQLSG